MYVVIIYKFFCEEELRDGPVLGPYASKETANSIGAFTVEKFYSENYEPEWGRRYKVYQLSEA